MAYSASDFMDEITGKLIATGVLPKDAFADEDAGSMADTGRTCAQAIERLHAQATGPKVWTYTEEDRHGTAVRLFTTKAAADAAAYAYAKERWNEPTMGPQGSDSPEMWERFFDHRNDCTLTVEELPIEGAEPEDADAEHYRTAAQAEHASDTLQIDAGARISRADDGAWVSSWVWVGNQAAGVTEDEDKDEEWDGPTDSDGAPCRFINHYECPRCKNEWQDQWSATCDDDCPQCGLTCSPATSEDA